MTFAQTVVSSPKKRKVAEPAFRLRSPAPALDASNAACCCLSAARFACRSLSLSRRSFSRAQRSLSRGRLEEAASPAGSPSLEEW